MASLWNETMTTGIESVDTQHKELFGHIALFGEAIEQGKNRFEINRALDAFAKKAMRHFAEEELCMENLRCQAAEANKKAHDDLLSKIDLFRERFASPGAKPAMALQFFDTLSRWWVKHVTEIDSQLRDCVEPSSTPAMASTC